MEPTESQVSKGLELAKAGKREEALAYLAGLVKAFPKSARAHYELASALDPLSREEEAIPHYQKALELDLSEEFRPEAVLGLGSSLRIVGRTREAVVLLEKAVKEYPRFAPLRAFRAFAHLATGEHTKKAVQELQNLIHGGELGTYEKVVRRYFRELVKNGNPHNLPLERTAAVKEFR
jgi:tetratricopeptide (TPR) repeat protein